MDPEAYERFTESLVSRLSVDDAVLGIVALGSMAYGADAHSDHDFFVITVPGLQERYRTDCSWLPEPDRIAISVRETPHGLKAVYDTGHIAEYAIFDTDELALARANRYRVLLDRERIGERMDAIATRSRSASDDELAALFAANVITGVNRSLRGERLSGERALDGALDHLIRLIERHHPASRGLDDDLDPVRRFETRYPDLAARIHEARSLPALQAANVLVDIAERVDAPGIDVVRTYLETVSR